MAADDERDSPNNESQDKANQLMKLLEALGMTPPLNAAAKKEHEFWNTQPVPKSSEDVVKVDRDGPLRAERPEIRIEPYSLPSGFEWCNVDIDADEDRSELYLLLNQNYVEDVDSHFRFDYPARFLEWALKAPGWHADWHFGIRSIENNELVAFISAIPTTLKVRSKEISSAEVNFLCIHKSLRTKRLAPLLIKEVTRRVHLMDIFQALYTAGIQLPEPICTSRYFHRPLNYKKLLEAGFTEVPPNRSVQEMCKHYELNKSLVALRPMTLEDIPGCFAIFTKFISKFELAPLFSQAEFEHWVMPRDDVIFSFVRDSKEGEPVDFVTFYSLPSSVLSGQKHSSINIAYLFYYGVSDELTLSETINAALWKAKELGFDVFNALDIMRNESFLRPLGFGVGDGTLHYYLYNWKTSLFSPNQVAVAML